ncbi:hypothetical protein SAMN05518847_106178 [Paenibacillus sp. OV219]|nr:hypothetical protein SAMN05518847_106178 [Paenibacillus sp. OV219]
MLCLRKSKAYKKLCKYSSLLLFTNKSLAIRLLPKQHGGQDSFVVVYHVRDVLLEDLMDVLIGSNPPVTSTIFPVK